MKKTAVLKKTKNRFWKSGGGLHQEHGKLLVFVMAMFLVFAANNALAFSTPSSGSLAYDLYDIAVNQILKGPIGFVTGIAFLVLCTFAIARQMVLPSILCLFAGVILVKADSIVQTLGCVIF
jgi:hypothetical protein